MQIWRRGWRYQRPKASETDSYKFGEEPNKFVINLQTNLILQGQIRTINVNVKKIFDRNEVNKQLLRDAVLG